VNQLFHKYLFFYLILVLFFWQKGFAQTSKTDSLIAQQQSVEGVDRVELLVNIAKAFYPNQLEKASKYGQEALALAEELDDIKGKAEVYFILAKTTRRLNNVDQALDYYFQAIENYRILDNQQGLGKCFNNVGIIHKNKGQFRLAFDYYDKAQTIFKETNDQKGEAHVLINKGIIFSKQGEYTKAINSYIKALKIREEAQDLREIAIINGNLGNLYNAQNEYETALQYHRKALKQFELLGETRNVGLVLNNIGLIYENKQLLDSSLFFYHKSSDIFDQLNYKAGKGISLGNMGSIYAKQKKYRNALNSHQQSLSIYQEIGKKSDIAEQYSLIGSILTELNRNEEALQNLQTGLKIAREIGDKETEILALEYLFKFYETTGNANLSFQYFKKYTTLKDSMYNIEKSQQIAEIQTKYETQKKEQENELLRNDQVVKNETISRQRFENTVLIIGTVLLLIFAIYIYRNNQQRKRTNQLLSQQNAEINQKQEENIKINDSLQQSQNQLNEANEALQKLNEGLETKIKERTNELQKSNQELDTFLYQSSHALRRPIVNVMGLMQLARMEKQKAGLHQLFEKIEHTATNMDLMLKKLVMASEINFINTNQHLVSFKGVIDKINNELNSILKDNGVAIQWSIDPQVQLKAHSRLIEIILQNLVENAIIYRSDPKTRKPEIKVKIESLNPPVKISVYDNGLGIAKDSLSNIFNMFSVASDKTYGYGLGLYLVKKAVDKLRGTIKVDSQENKFTSFEIIIPQ